MFGSFRLQNLGTEAKLILYQDIAFINLVLAKIRNIVTADIGTVPVEISHLIRNLIRCLHRLAQNDGIGIKTVTPAAEFPFLARRLAEFLVR